MGTQAVQLRSISSRRCPFVSTMPFLILAGCSGSDGGFDTLTGPNPSSRFAVSDLRVADEEVNELTLRFREVDDGTGSPASYDVRFAKAGLGSDWGSATSVSEGSCRVPVAGTEIGKVLACTVAGLEPGTRYEFQLVPFRGTMNEDATYGPLSNVATGETADAPVRIEVLPASSTLEEGNTLRFRARVTDSDGNSVETAVSWSSSHSSVASISGSGSSITVKALSPGEADIRASAEGVYGSAKIRVVRRNSSGARRPNEPAGFSRIAEHDFSCRPGGSCALAGRWGESDGGFHRSNLSVVERSDAPAGGRSVVRTRFPRGLRAGSGPASFWGWSTPGREYRAVYISKWIRIAGSDYQNHPTLTKMGWIGYGQSDIDNQGYLGVQTRGGNGRVQLVREVQPTFRQQNHVGRAEWGSGMMRVGQWYHWEVLLELNDLGRRNGVVRWWIDGRLVLSKTDMVYITRGDARGFFSYRWNPTWGGAGDFVRTRDDFMEIAHIYISGIPK